MAETVEFACARCGDCCRKHGLYPVTSSDVVEMAGHMATETGEFLDRFCAVAVNDGRRGLFVKGAGGVCPFLEGRDCSVHVHKPLACSIFPDNDGYVTVRRLKEDMKSATIMGPGLSRCAVWDLPDDGVLGPNLEATVRFRIREDTDRQYFACHDRIDADTVERLAGLAAIRLSDLPLCLSTGRKYGLLRQFYTAGLPDVTPLVQAERDILYRYCATYATSNVLPEAVVEPQGVRATFVDGKPGVLVLCDRVPPAGDARFLHRRYGETGVFAAVVGDGGFGYVTAFVIHTPCLDDILGDEMLYLAFSDGTKKVTYACREGIF